MTALTVAWTELRRAARDRTYLFFVLFLPFMVILLIGVTTSGLSQERVGILRGEHSVLADALVTGLDSAPGLESVAVADRESGVQRLSYRESPFPTWGRAGAGEASEDCLHRRRGFPLPTLPHFGGGGCGVRVSLRR